MGPQTEPDVPGASSLRERPRRRVVRQVEPGTNPRPGSTDRHICSTHTSTTSRKELQEIFLGNNPQTQPAITENALSRRPPAAPKSRTRLFRSVFHQHSNPSIQAHTPVETNMHLEGSRYTTNEGS
ncbi:hypothetical protein ElyMa_002872100 [Elysia marginata]|uniref:Uncharacterized protein n=1 Tax=Elysia marginata TaxID=1093978 RepID=A0AAV4HXU4_9GAST|nr:hypothetical protein ElyMa_002872100 [Elysia marginata]